MRKKIYTLCGSMKFIDVILEVQEKLELEGNVVIGMMQTVQKEPYTQKELDVIAEVHKAKIDMADAIFVVNVGGYIGKSTKEEIIYAMEKNKKIEYYADSFKG